ncbi:ead/Ea22-like family protein [Escherichia coli]|uniref:ead/Ea22-like family protein n=1 Tax=Escherichia coli TaxID=562 RepID=UPI00191C8098|nr:ead/Ea22-like family protein [Escherichia coli]MCH8586242.1 ead/Ea22-like family protein [Escherichia coli]HEI1517975.1 ead/Ea22-like family protein [Escherichia coli]
MSEINYQALREAAEKATKGQWAVEFDDEIYSTDGVNHEQIAMVFSENESRDAAFIAAANPATVLALLDELERNQQYIKRRDQENEDIALTVGKLRVELEGKDSKIANLTAERDALREGEMGDARHSNTRSAADIYFQLVEECEIPAGGSLVEYVDDMREKLEAAEKRIAELEAEPVSQTYKLNELSGNSPVTPDGWISCSERMPEETGDIIVVSDGIVMSGISYSRRDGFYIAALEYDDDEPIGGVTHWMPLPEPPRLKEL